MGTEDLIRVHPHVAIAAACSSTGATRGSDSCMTLDPSERSTDTGESDSNIQEEDFDDDEWVAGTLQVSPSTSSDSSSEAVRVKDMPTMTMTMSKILMSVLVGLQTGPETAEGYRHGCSIKTNATTAWKGTLMAQTPTSARPP